MEMRGASLEAASEVAASEAHSEVRSSEGDIRERS